MNEPLRITVRVFGARPHQAGNPEGKYTGYFNLSEKAENPHGPVIEHVRDGKPLTALGRKMLGGAQ